MKALHHVIETRLMEIPEQNTEAMNRLRIQLLRLASGKPVTKEMILSGQPYMDLETFEAKKFYEEEKNRVFLLDVRTAQDYNKKRIPGAKLIPVQELENRYQTEIPLDASKILVYCARGERSRTACEFLSRQGYTNIYNLKEGINQWPGPTEEESEFQLIHIESHP
jgi:rhodanese-related sulfurtransferase